ncbi:hypothetical protein ACFFX0_01385 [Citricoccus parietis]|uniref:Uncharacterized protein n=1 Tax=Citricoccus parietis TaxID=592307 RepID=A0ABV5FTA2_9MICC
MDRLRGHHDLRRGPGAGPQRPAGRARPGEPCPHGAVAGGPAHRPAA